MEYSLPVSGSQYILLALSRLMWCLYRIYQLIKSRCRCKWDVFEKPKQSTALHVSVRFIFLTDMCSFCWQKCGPRPKLFLRLDIFSTFRGVHTLIFTYVPYIITDMRNRRIFMGKSEALLSWLAIRLVFLPLICLVTTQILISENQTMWKLEILLLKTKDIKTRARNISR